MVKISAIMVLLLCAGSAYSSSSNQVILADVPAYLWTGGCVPTSIGMIFGYWDQHGYANMIPGSYNWSTNQGVIQSTIASAGYFRDYYPTPDRQATPSDPYHTDDCIADFAQTSRINFSSGGTSWNTIANGFSGWANYRGYGGSVTSSLYSGSGNALWNKATAEINAGRPFGLGTDSDGDGVPDHFVPVLGFDPDSRQLAIWDTWDTSLQWINFAAVKSGQAWGTYGAVFFTPSSPDVKGDGNYDHLVNDADYTLWADNFSKTGVQVPGDFNLDGAVNDADYTVWADYCGKSVPVVPEPTTAALLGLGLMLFRRK